MKLDTDLKHLGADLAEPEMAERFAHIYRYAQVGRCVNGVTHDINNFLGAMLAYVELVSLEEGLSEESQRMLGEVMNGVGKCSDLISGLTAIARPEKLTVNLLDPIPLAQAVMTLRQYSLRVAQIQVETDFPELLPTLIGDAPKLKLALLYLLMNAQEALEKQETARLLRFRVALDGDAIAFSVWNSGDGVTEAMFEPFVSDKDGEHIGYGLQAVQDIADLHEGKLFFDTERGMVLSIPRSNALQHYMDI